MNQAADFSAYPLPAALTRRVVGYLNLFRLFISFALTVAFFTGLLVRAYFLDSGAIAGTVLVSYFVIAVYQGHDQEGSFHILRATVDTEVLNMYITSLDIRPSSDVFLINHEGVLQTPSRHHGTILEPGPIDTPPPSEQANVDTVDDEQGETRILGHAYIEDSPFIFVVLKHPED